MIKVYRINENVNKDDDYTALFELDYIPREGESLEYDGKWFNVQKVIHRKPLFGEKQVLVLVRDTNISAYWNKKI